jgi:transposase-like protein
MTETAATPDKKPKRAPRRSGTAPWHMSRKAVNIAVPDVTGMSKRECVDWLVKARWGSRDTVCCPHCGTTGRHYWRALEYRWKCQGCGSTFSVTSGTVYANHRRPLQQIVANALMFLNSAGGQTALETKRNFNTSYNTAFVWSHKLREGLVRGFNVGPVNGDIEMDGAHQSGFRSKEKRGRPLAFGPPPDEMSQEELNAAILTQAGKDKVRRKKRKGVVDPEFGRTLPENRRILMTVCKRSGQRGKGTCATRVAVALSESPAVVAAVIKEFVAAPESNLNTDSGGAFTTIGKQFQEHRTVEHTKRFSGPNGENNNQAEALNGRYDRAEKGIYLNIEPKYLLDYAVETSFRSDVRRIPNGKQLQLLFHTAMSVGHSEFWRGFTHGHHREMELIVPMPQPAPASGPRKGRKPIASLNGRPPR